MIGLTLGLLLLAVEKSAEALSTLTGTDLSSWLHSYGKKSLEDDDYAILQDATIDQKSKYIIQAKNKRIKVRTLKNPQKV